MLPTMSLTCNWRMKNAVHYMTMPNILEAIRYTQELFNSIAADTCSDSTPTDIVKLSAINITINSPN